jgi:hypothetical protein
VAPLDEDEVVHIVRSYLEGLFPRACPRCGRRFESLREYLQGTTHLSSPILYEDLTDEVPEKPIGPMSLANCPCGTTISIGSRGIPAATMVELLTWARQESATRSIGLRELLSHIRDRIDDQVLDTSQNRRRHSTRRRGESRRQADRLHP